MATRTLPADLRPGLPDPSSLWIAVAAVLLAACSGAVTQYATSVVPSPGLGHPLIDARRCLETLGFDMKIIDLEAGLISGEKFELADTWSSRVVVSEVSVISDGDRVRIIAHSRQASSASGGWESARISERVRRAVDRLADRLGDGRSGGRLQCESFLTREDDDIARDARTSRRGRVPPVEGPSGVAGLSRASVIQHAAESRAAELYVPPLRSTAEQPHPLVRAFLSAAADAGMDGPLMT